MRCCADSKDEDIEKQCKAQTNLPANQICRYDVDTIKCAPTAYRTTAPAVLVSTAPVMSQDMMAARTKEGKSGSTLWFISFASCLAFFVCLLLAVMLAFCYKKKILTSLWCSGRIDRVIITRKYSRARESHRWAYKTFSGKNDFSTTLARTSLPFLTKIVSFEPRKSINLYFHTHPSKLRVSPSPGI